MLYNHMTVSLIVVVVVVVVVVDIKIIIFSTFHLAHVLCYQRVPQR